MQILTVEVSHLHFPFWDSQEDFSSKYQDTLGLGDTWDWSKASAGQWSGPSLVTAARSCTFKAAVWACQKWAELKGGPFWTCLNWIDSFELWPDWIVWFTTQSGMPKTSLRSSHRFSGPPQHSFQIYLYLYHLGLDINLRNMKYVYYD